MVACPNWKSRKISKIHCKKDVSVCVKSPMSGSTDITYEHKKWNNKVLHFYILFKIFYFSILDMLAKTLQNELTDEGMIWRRCAISFGRRIFEGLTVPRFGKTLGKPSLKESIWNVSIIEVSTYYRTSCSILYLICNLASKRYYKTDVDPAGFNGL